MKELAFSYPNAATESVPQNAVFWAIGDSGPVSKLSLDGEELPPLGLNYPERFQYAPPEPLAPGSHEVAITLPRSEGATAEEPERTTTFRFEVTEPSYVESDAEISAITEYPGWTPSEEAYAGDCSDRAINLSEDCYDIIPHAIVRLDLAPDPRALGYITSSNYVLPADCAVFFPYPYAQPSNEPHSIAAILPTGLGAEVPFDGATETVPYQPPPGIYRDGPPAWCALPSGGLALSSSGRFAGRAELVAALASAMLWLGRRRARARCS